MIAREPDERVRLEAAGSAVWFGAALGQDTIGRYVWDDDVRADLRMEAVLVLTEMVGDTFSRSVLEDVAETSKFKGSEVRQAAIWGLGKSGMKAYSKLLREIAQSAQHALDQQPPLAVGGPLLPVVVRRANPVVVYAVALDGGGASIACVHPAKVYRSPSVGDGFAREVRSS